jgi:hypothetical protein
LFVVASGQFEPTAFALGGGYKAPLLEQATHGVVRVLLAFVSGWNEKLLQFFDQ